MSFAHGLRPEFRFPNGLYKSAVQSKVHRVKPHSRIFNSDVAVTSLLSK